MAEKPAAAQAGNKPTKAEKNVEKTRERRKIPGNLPYTSAPGVLRSVLEKIPDAEKPGVFNADFLSAVFGVSGGSARPIPPILKSTGLLNQSGAPTELYSDFQTTSGRSNAALEALRNGFSEIFKRNQYAHKLDEKGLLDLIVTITGLPRADPVTKSIQNTFQVFQRYAKDAKEQKSEPHEQEGDASRDKDHSIHPPNPNLGLVYNINISIPETTNIEVYNAIFRSIKLNLMQ